MDSGEMGGNGAGSWGIGVAGRLGVFSWDSSVGLLGCVSVALGEGCCCGRGRGLSAPLRSVWSFLLLSLALALAAAGWMGRLLGRRGVGGGGGGGRGGVGLLLRSG